MHLEIYISANVNYDWALNLSTRYFLLIVVHPFSGLLHRIEKFWRRFRVSMWCCQPLVGGSLPLSGCRLKCLHPLSLSPVLWVVWIPFFSCTALSRARPSLPEAWALLLLCLETMIKSLHFFIQQLSLDHFLCAGHVARGWGCSSEFKEEGTTSRDCSWPYGTCIQPTGSSTWNFESPHSYNENGGNGLT